MTIQTQAKAANAAKGVAFGKYFGWGVGLKFIYFVGTSDGLELGRAVFEITKSTATEVCTPTDTKIPCCAKRDVKPPFARLVKKSAFIESIIELEGADRRLEKMSTAKFTFVEEFIDFKDISCFSS